MDTFEALLAECSPALERFVYFRLPSKFDTDDILQEVSLAAYQKFSALKNKDSFKPWILAIARINVMTIFAAGERSERDHWKRCRRVRLSMDAADPMDSADI